MIREEYLRRLVDEAYVDLYLAGNDGARIYWPWRMARHGCGSLSNRYRNACENYWVDSAIGDDSYGNKDALDDAHRYDAEGVLLADVMGDYDATVEQVLRGLELADDHPFDGDVIIPLQAPYDECYAELAGQSTHYAIGGLKDCPSDSRRIDAARTVRELAGHDIHLHGLGWGPRDGLARAIHNDPELLDSIDYSTPVQSSVEAMAGDERKSVVASEAAAMLIRDLRKLTPNVDFNPEPSELRQSDQSGLEELA